MSDPAWREELRRRKALLVPRIEELGFPAKEVVLTLDEFFAGNEEASSIGVNLSSPPPPEEFHRVLKALIDRGDAERILVRVNDIQDPADWFYSDAIHVIGTIGREALADAVAQLHPDEVYEGWMYGVPVNADPVTEGLRVYTLWWD